ncbi:hypothetical protein GQ42DRAFT_62984 [Ramicandelaber brevisporus]|nr:hypothetical protein GQ42DRAFT_62984 [Ramicandelaber brevisporus]
MSVTTMSCFRLFDLPLDLLELLTLYFEGSEAVKVLTVSSNFHDIFARSVWHTITRGTIDVVEPIRSSAYARYGHLVRSINLISKVPYDLDSHNWTQLFPNTTSMAFNILLRMKDDDKQAFMDSIANLHGLRSLTINMRTYMLSFDLETLATVLLARHSDPNKQSLREVAICFNTENFDFDYDYDEDCDDDEEEEKLWIGLSSFVKALSPLRRTINLQIDIRGYDCTIAPTPAQMDILRPHLTAIPDFKMAGNDGNEYGCTALRNRQLFSVSGTCDDSLVFDRLGTIDISVCCASPLLFDYSDFTLAKFPVMETMAITVNECSHQTEEGANSAFETILLQTWPMLKDLKAYGQRLPLSIMNTLIELNPQLADLTTRIRPNTDDGDGVIMLDHTIGRLPDLTKLSLHGEPSILLDSDWLNGTSLIDIRSSKLRSISIHATTLSHRVFEVLLALPNLLKVVFWDCLLADPKLVKNVFEKHRRIAKEDATASIINLSIESLRDNSNWSAEIVLEMIASLPRLNLCTIYGKHALRSAIQEKYPKAGDIGANGHSGALNTLTFNPQSC